MFTKASLPQTKKVSRLDEFMNLEIENLREDCNQTTDHVSEVDNVLTEGEKERQADSSTVGILMSEKPLFEEVLEDDNSFNRFDSSAAKNKYSVRWTVGDKVIAFVDNKWREVVIHEVHKNEFYVIPVDQSIKPLLVELSLIKSSLVPVDALNKMEADVAAGRKVLNDAIINEDPSNDVNSGVCMKSITLTPSLLLRADDVDLCTFARTGAGSRFLQSLVSQGNKKLCEKIVSSILSTNSLRMMTNPVSCFLVQKMMGYLYILPESQQADLLDQIRLNFSKLSLSPYGYHVVKAAIVHLGWKQREAFILELENKTMLLSLLKSKYGTFIAQACIPYFQSRTVTFLVNSLVGHVVELSCHPSATYFIQQLLTQWGQSSLMDMLDDDILRHIRDLVHHPQGAYVVQALLRVRGDYAHLALLTEWIVSNIQAVYKDKTAIQVVRCVVYLLSDKTAGKRNGHGSKLLNTIIERMLQSDEQQNRPHLIQAACHREGCVLVTGLIKVVMRLDMAVWRRMQAMISSYRAALMADTNGCFVLKNLQGIQ